MGVGSLVATDLDGTLLRSDGTVSARSQQVLAQLEERGIPVVFVTARPLRWMTSLWPLVGGHGLAIISNGAVLYDVAAARVVDLAGVDRTVGLQILADVEAAIPGVGLGIERLPSGMARNEAYVPDLGAQGLPDEFVVGDLAELWDAPVVKLLVRSATVEPSELQRVTAQIVGDRALPTWSTPGLVEISASGVTKAWRLRQLCDRLGVAAADVVAFGDMPNDLPMLEWAGHPHAVANAHPDLIARFPVVGSNDDDGVATTLASIFGGSA